MKLFSKILLSGALAAGISVSAVPTAQAFWFGKKDNAQTCKLKFDNRCQAVEDAKGVCDNEFSDFCKLSDKLVSDLQNLKEAQIVSEKIFSALQVAYEVWKSDGFRVDTQSYTEYAALKSKFENQNREIAECESLLSAEIRDMYAALDSLKKSKQDYMSSLDSALEAYYSYSVAAAKESLPTE